MSDRRLSKRTQHRLRSNVARKVVEHEGPSIPVPSASESHQSFEGDVVDRVQLGAGVVEEDSVGVVSGISCG